MNFENRSISNAFMTKKTLRLTFLDHSLCRTRYQLFV